MVELDSVMEELHQTRLMDLVPPQYLEVLQCMAELADENDSRELSATYIQIAKRSFGYTHGSVTPVLVAHLITCLTSVGIVGLVAEGDPLIYEPSIKTGEWQVSEGKPATYRFASYRRLVEIAAQIQENQNSEDAPLLPTIVPKNSPFRTRQ